MMKRLILNRQRDVELIETAKPEPNRNEITLELIACGICGTDKFYYTQAEKPVLYWGHEVLGEIVACGEDVSTDLLGRKVLTKTTNPCGQCKFCHRGEYQKCSGWQRHAYNGFSSYLVLPTDLTVLLPPDDYKFEYVLAEPLNVALDIVGKIQREVQKEDEILISGLGPLGLMTIFLLNKLGYTRVFAYGKRGALKRNQLAAEWGVRKIYFADELEEAHAQFELAVLTTPYRTLPAFSRHIRYGGTIIYNGIHEEQVVPLNLHELHFQRISLLPSFPHPQGDFQEAITLIQRYASELAKLISHQLPLEDGENAFALLENAKADVLKIIITR